MTELIQIPNFPNASATHRVRLDGRFAGYVSKIGGKWEALSRAMKDRGTFKLRRSAIAALRG